ncbi:MAG: glucohydrolase, partial [Oscillospiraceae bacterium]|nr:glucohydrolase [Oscillospiraceae bacterium]
AYSRTFGDDRLFVCANFSPRPVRYVLPPWVKGARVLLDNYGRYQRGEASVALSPYQALILAEA